MINTTTKTEAGITVITSQVEINSSKEHVWEVLKNVGEIDKFHPMIKKSKATTERLNGLGARRHCALAPMGQMEEEVIEWDEGSSFIMKVVGGKMLPPYHFMNGRIELKELDSKTQVEFSFSYQLKYGVLGILMNVLFIRPQFKNAPPKYVVGLKRFIEAQ